MSSQKGSPSEQPNLDEDLIKAIRRKARQEEMDARADGRFNRSSFFKSKKDYDRKDKSWRGE